MLKNLFEKQLKKKEKTKQFPTKRRQPHLIFLKLHDYKLYYGKLLLYYIKMNKQLIIFVVNNSPIHTVACEFY